MIALIQETLVVCVPSPPIIIMIAVTAKTPYKLRSRRPQRSTRNQDVMFPANDRAVIPIDTLKLVEAEYPASWT